MIHFHIEFPLQPFYIFVFFFIWYLFVMLIVGDNQNVNNHKIINSLLKEEIYTNDLLSNVMCVLKPKVFKRSEVNIHKFIFCVCELSRQTKFLFSSWSIHLIFLFYIRLSLLDYEGGETWSEVVTYRRQIWDNLSWKEHLRMREKHNVFKLHSLLREEYTDDLLNVVFFEIQKRLELSIFCAFSLRNVRNYLN